MGSPHPPAEILVVVHGIVMVDLVVLTRSQASSLIRANA
jgi:hypothetical protein